MAGENRDFPITPSSYLYLQNIGSGGVISVRRGPCVVTQSGQELPVKFDPERRRYIPTSSIDQAVVQFPVAGEGDYVVLENPSVSKNGEGFPSSNVENAIDLATGRRIVIPGPWSQALWPGQIADVIQGHRMRSNQYLIAIIYNAVEAEQNWESGIIAESQAESLDEDPMKFVAKKGNKGLPKPSSFAVGTRILISGEDVSFFIPCTGVEVLRDEKTNRYVRDAVTLEQMEYCCLIGEDGKKNYPRGPKVVFPEPTQIFDEDKNGRRKFRPIELNTINGIHLKVTADFEDDDFEKPADGDGKRPQRKYQEGEELFVKGTALAIYYPREELAIIEYGQGKKKHFSTAIPKGEGRYMIDREKGSIALVTGPNMLLPDPRTQILVRRSLSPDECELMYPGNAEAMAYNLDLNQMMATVPSGRSGVVSEGDYRKVSEKRNRRMKISSGYNDQEGLTASADMGQTSLEAFSGPEQFVAEEVSSGQGRGASLTRGTKYTEPRQLTLNTKYDGAVKVEVWPGYAILIVGSEGHRRVVEGPETVLLQYDEKLGHMELSTGKPKNSDELLNTSFLKVQNNQVGDIVAFESSDGIKGSVKISLRVNFKSSKEADKLAWFGVDNYVKYLTDHVRSIIAGMGKRNTIAEIKAQYIDLVRDSILGLKPETIVMDDDDERDDSTQKTSREGLSDFTNGMHVFEVEVLQLNITDKGIAALLDQSQHKVVETNIELDQARKDLEATEDKEKIMQLKLKAQHATMRTELDLEKEIIGDQLKVVLAKIESSLMTIAEQAKEKQAYESITDISHNARLTRELQESEQELDISEKAQALEVDLLKESTEAAVLRFAAAKDGLSEVLLTLSRDELAEKLSEACNMERYLSGDSMGSSISNLLAMFPQFQNFLDNAGKGAKNRFANTPSNS